MKQPKQPKLGWLTYLKRPFYSLLKLLTGAEVERYTVYHCPECAHDNVAITNCVRHIRLTHPTSWLLTPNSTWIRLLDTCVRLELEELLANVGDFNFFVDIVQEKL